jgi:hypothetical protein
MKVGENTPRKILIRKLKAVVNLTSDSATVDKIETGRLTKMSHISNETR